MAKHLAGWMSPWQEGLLSGISSAGSELDKFNLMRMQNEGRLQAYQVKYGAQAMKAQNDQLLKRLQMEANQRSYKGQVTGDDGKSYDVTYRNQIGADGTVTPMEMGRVPSKDPEALQTAREIAITDRQTNAINAGQDRADTRQNAINSRLDRRDADSAAKEDQKEQAAKSDKLDARVEKDMDKFDAADPSEQATLLKAAGVSPTVSQTSPGMIYGTNTKDVPNPDARDAYEAAITAKHAKTMGIKTPSAPASGSGGGGSNDPSSAPAISASGQPILKKDGKFYMTDKDGKKVEVHLDAQGQPIDAPALAMDDQSGASPTAMPDQSGASDDDSSSDADQSQGGGLLASAGQAAPAPEDMGSQESDQEDDDDDAAQDQQSQALLA